MRAPESFRLVLRSYPTPYPARTSPRYADLQRHLRKNWAALAIGLNRGVSKIAGMGHKDNRMPYVCTNPPGDTIVHSVDSVFVLSAIAPPRDVGTLWGALSRTLINKLDGEKLKVPSTVSGIGEACSRIADSVKSIEERLSALEDRLQG